MLSYAMLHCAVVCHAMLCYVMPYHVDYTMSSYIVVYHVAACVVSWRDTRIMLQYVMSSQAVLRYRIVLQYRT